MIYDAVVMAQDSLQCLETVAGSFGSELKWFTDDGPAEPIISYFIKIKHVTFTFLMPAYPGCPGKRPSDMSVSHYHMELGFKLLGEGAGVGCFNVPLPPLLWLPSSSSSAMHRMGGVGSNYPSSLCT